MTTIQPEDIEQLLTDARAAAVAGDQWAAHVLALAPMSLHLRAERDAAESLCVALVVRLGGDLTITQQEWSEAEEVTIAVGETEDGYRFRAVPA